MRLQGRQRQRRDVKRKGGKLKWAILGSAAVLLLVLAGGYVGMTMYYRTHFFPGSSINGISCGGMDAAEAAILVDGRIDGYSLQVWGRGDGSDSVLIGEISPEDAGLSYVDSLKRVEALLEGQNEWGWIPANITGKPCEYTLEQGVSFDENILKKTVAGWEACREENMREARDAYIGERSGGSGYEIVPEEQGTRLDMDKVWECITDALYRQGTSVDLEQAQCYVEPQILRTDPKLAEAVETANTWLKTEITYDWNGGEVILDAETIKEWVSMEGNEPVLDEDAVAAFVETQADAYDTYGKRGTFVTVHGIELTLPRLSYGWATDREAETDELLELIRQGSVTEREPIYGIRAQRKGQADIGNNYIEADLTHQHLYVHQDGRVVFETDVVSGKTNSVPSHGTPSGIFGLTYKTTNAVLRGRDYVTPVNYWMPFYGNYGMHDATWRWDFGLTIYQNHGSHGCINLPLDAAAVIYQYVFTGYPIICYYYDVDPLPPVTDRVMPSEEELLKQEEGVSMGSGSEVSPEG